VRWRTVLVVAVPLALVGAVLWSQTRDVPVAYGDAVEHFKYGSVGSEPGGSLLRPIGGLLPPYWVFKVLPRLCPSIASYADLGLIVERNDDGTEKDLPIGISRRRRLGMDMVGVNCALCHAGTVRDAPGARPLVIAGMPPQQPVVQRLFRFVFDCIESPQFTASDVIREVRAAGGPAGLLEQGKYRLLVPRIRGQVRDLEAKIGLLTGERVPASGPGRLDTVNPGKALEVGWDLAAQLDGTRRRELIGTADFPSVWNLDMRDGLRLHWDGNIGSVHEALMSAALAVGAKPQTLDRAAFERVVSFLRHRPSPPYPYLDTVDREKAARGAILFEGHCAECHAGSRIGEVTPNGVLGADAHRLNAFSPEYAARLPVALNRRYGASEFRFMTFRKTDGYVNLPLDGIWARAPYLHNGSVPTLRDLLEPERCRPALFRRGSDVYDRRDVGFLSYAEPSTDRACSPRRQAEAAHTPERAPGEPPLFLFDTSLPGNASTGHRWGTELPVEQKDELVEFLKTL
jgi:hypothetical protein